MHGNPGLGSEGRTGARFSEADTSLAVSSFFDFMMTATKGRAASTGLLLKMSNVSIMIIITTFKILVETVFFQNMFCSILETLQKNSPL